MQMCLMVLSDMSDAKSSRLLIFVYTNLPSNQLRCPLIALTSDNPDGRVPLVCVCPASAATLLAASRSLSPRLRPSVRPFRDSCCLDPAREISPIL